MLARVGGEVIRMGEETAIHAFKAPRTNNMLSPISALGIELFAMQSMLGLCPVKLLRLVTLIFDARRVRCKEARLFAPRSCAAGARCAGPPLAPVDPLDLSRGVVVCFVTCQCPRCVSIRLALALVILPGADACQTSTNLCVQYAHWRAIEPTLCALAGLCSLRVLKIHDRY